MKQVLSLHEGIGLPVLDLKGGSVVGIFGFARQRCVRVVCNGKENGKQKDMNKEQLLKQFEDRWGDDLKFVLHEQDVRELFSDISKLIDKLRPKVKDVMNTPHTS